MRLKFKLLPFFIFILFIYSCSFGYQRNIEANMGVENDFVLFSSVEDIAKELGMVLVQREADAKGRTILSYVDKTKVREKYQIGIGVFRDKVTKEGKGRYFVTCGVAGLESKKKEVRSEVDNYFDLLLKSVEKLESKGYLRINDIH